MSVAVTTTAEVCVDASTQVPYLEDGSNRMWAISPFQTEEKHGDPPALSLAHAAPAGAPSGRAPSAAPAPAPVPSATPPGVGATVHAVPVRDVKPAVRGL